MLNTSRATGAGLRGALWLPFVDLLQFVVFVSSFFSSHVVARHAFSRRPGRLAVARERIMTTPTNPAADAAERNAARARTAAPRGVAARAGLRSPWLIWREHPLDILHRLQIAGAGLLLAALAHILPMLANAWTGGC